ncbi:MAG: CotH kinase family protein, partial [Muribaculaceae bacterium]|nr:CotH kinase family protein [Muribaculaceae bacterium]
PTPSGGQEVADNRNMSEKAEIVKNHLRQKIQWLKNQFGDFTAQTFAEPERDNTTAQPLPDYVKPADPPTPIDPTPDDPTSMPEVFLRGDVNGWNASSEYKMTYENETYTIHVNELNGKFKFASADWNTINFGAGAINAVTHSSTFPLVEDGSDFIANNLRDVTLSFPYVPGIRETTLTVVVNGEVDPIPDPTPGNNGISGSLPVLYINVYTDSAKTHFNNEIISKNLDHKNYFQYADYRLDVNGCQWLIDLGARDLGSADNMLPLQIKARGNWTRKGFSKKPFKLKLDKKASMLGMTKSKHYAILAHADDDTGYLKNFTGFNLGKRMGLPWTPGMQPIEVVINGDYRGLYFLTESIRVGDDRVMITELADNEEDASLASGGYLVELDNYDEDNQIRMTEKGCVNTWTRDMLRITFDTPEEYSDVQKRFIRDQFSIMNDAIGSNSDDLWKLMDLDDAARYYLVEEIISHYEAYHGSTYLFRDFGEGQKWHFSPLWDCGNAFRGPTNNFFYNVPGLGFGNTWIPSMRANDTFNNKVEDSWKWFMSNRFDGIYEDIDLFASRVQAAAEADYKRWHNVAPPDGGQGVADNRNMTEKAEIVKNHLRQKIEWLKNRFGDFTAQTFPEPERDNTEAMPLPDYVKPA